MNRCYFAADVETSVGFAFPPVSSIVSVGLCVIGNPNENFYAELKPISDHWDLEAQKIHGLSRSYLQQYGGDPWPVMEALDRWTREVAGDAIPVFCALPISYDFRYVDEYFERAAIVNPFIETQDGRDLYRRMYRIPNHVHVPREKIWAEFPTSIPHIHHALSDALEYEQVHGAMLRAAGLL